jgi:hypothetical protein
MWSSLLNDPLDFFTKKRYTFTQPVSGFATVNSSTRFRLDLIALDNSQAKENWWIYAEANNLIWPFDEVELDTILNLPYVSNVSGYEDMLAEYTEQVITLLESGIE